MSKSLNQAFINAYLRQHAGDQQSPRADDKGENLRFRVDAARRGPVEPHLDARPGNSQTAPVGVPSERRSETAQAHSAPPRKQPATTELPAENRVQPDTSDAPNDEVLAWNTIVASPGLIDWAVPHIAANLADSHSHEAAPSQRSDATPPLGYASSRTAERKSASSGAGKRGGDLPIGGGGGPVTRHIELEPPSTPALSPESYREAIERLARRQNKILRVDSPAARQSNAFDTTAASGQRTAVAPKPSPSGTEPESAVRAKALEIEQGLRRAKSRFFNPSWEVDYLDWPAVCDKLLRQNYEAMDLVGRNLFQACQDGLQVLAVAGISRGHGATTVACCLAMLASAYGLRVALVDGNLENPSLAEATNLELEVDWSDAIEGDGELEQTAVHSIEDQLTLIPLLKPLSQKQLNAQKNSILARFQELKESFDLVLIDAGALDAKQSLLVTLGKEGIIDAVATVVDCRKDHARQLESQWRRLRAEGINPIGRVENFAA